MNLTISGWGNYPKIKANIITSNSIGELKSKLEIFSSVIPRALARSYGDSSLNDNILSSVKFNRILAFEKGTLTCEAGTSLEEILRTIIPKGWFLPVTPGTKFVTAGGAITSDVHGKNHHKEGSFSDHIISMEVMLPNGEIVTCSKEKNTDLFKATCGGMGLTGFILTAAFKLKKIETAFVKQKTIKAENLDEIIELFEQYKNYTFSVAWIDCLAAGKHFGRGILILGEHAIKEDIAHLKISKNSLAIKEKIKLNIPFNFPSFTMNPFTIKTFNFIFYYKHFKKIQKSITDYDTFFYPLDGIGNWNRIYGSKGFTQYQFVLPKNAGTDGLKKILTKISNSGRGAFLSVIKLFGKGNDNLISFPIEGYTLAVDFPITSNLFPFLDELDKIVLDYGGRLYLTKDARMSPDMFRKGYNKSDEFINFKHKIDKENKFQSLQSKRLGI